jgi:thiol-disulfide isomerase/thioredoxin
MQRIASLLPSTTEIVCALGLAADLVGHSHECDFPPEVTALPALTQPKLEILSEILHAAEFPAKPCTRAISPILHELAAEYAGRVQILELHTGENSQAMARYRVMALPTVLAFAKGRVVGQLTGARPKTAFRELVERGLAGSSLSTRGLLAARPEGMCARRI